MESVIRPALVYLFLLLVLRLTGKRTLAQITTFDFVLLLIIAETTQQALLGDDFSIANAVLLILTLFVADVVLSYVKEWMPSAGKWIDGVPTVLISLGKPDQRAMQRARVAMDDILDAAREQHGLERLDQIKFAVLEVGGHLSIIPAEKISLPRASRRTAAQ